MTHNGGRYQQNPVSRWGRAATHTGDSLSSFCPSHSQRAERGSLDLNKEALKVFNRRHNCDSSFHLQSNVCSFLGIQERNKYRTLSEVSYSFFHAGSTYKLWLIKTFTRTVFAKVKQLHVLFILTILFGVFTNKHMQEVDSDWHYGGTEHIYSYEHIYIFNSWTKGCLQATWHQREKERWRRRRGRYRSHCDTHT